MLKVWIFGKREWFYRSSFSIETYLYIRFNWPLCLFADSFWKCFPPFEITLKYRFTLAAFIALFCRYIIPLARYILSIYFMWYGTLRIYKYQTLEKKTIYVKMRRILVVVVCFFCSFLDYVLDEITIETIIYDGPILIWHWAFSTDFYFILFHSISADTGTVLFFLSAFLLAYVLRCILSQGSSLYYFYILWKRFNVLAFD